MDAFETTDKTLVTAYINGNESALEQLLERHKRRLHAYIYKYVRDSDLTEDLFQDTFIKVIKSLKSGNYNEEGKFLPWVYRIAHNLVIDYFSKSNRLHTTTGGEAFDIFSIIPNKEKNIEQQLFTQNVRKDVRVYIQQLPTDQKEVLMMRVYYDMSFKEIADKTNVSINTALGRMRYALINMRKLMEESSVALSNR